MYRSLRRISRLLLFSISIVVIQPGICRCGGISKMVIVSPAWAKYTHEDGSGLYFELMRRVYERHGIEVITVIVPWKRGKVMILNGQADCMLAAYLTPNDDRWTYPQYPIDVDRTAAVFLRQKVQSWLGPETMSGRSVVWPRGYNFQNYMDVEVEWIEIDEARQGWGMIEMGRADFYMDILPEIESYMEKNNLDRDRYGIETVFAIKTYVRFGTGPEADKLRQIYDLEVRKLHGSGELRALYEKWTDSFPEFAFSSH